MTQVELRPVAKEDEPRLYQQVNVLIDRDRGDSSGWVQWYGFDGNKKKTNGDASGAAGSNVATGQYTFDVHSSHASGLLLAARLSATTKAAAPTVSNCSVLIQNSGLLIGAAKALTIYATGGSNNASLSADAAGNLVLGGTTGELILNGNVKWKSGTAFVMQLDHTATADRTITVPDATDTLALLGLAQTFSATNTFSSAAPIILTGTATRITGPFEHATRGSRPFFQSSAANGDTNVSAMPSGSNTISKFEAHNNSTPGSATVIASLEANGTEARLTAATNAGAAAALLLYVGSTNVINATTAGVVSLPVGQLAFPATQNASADANTLDDYEEGNWTPAVGGTATYTNQIGRYTKIGRCVFVSCHLTINAIGTGSANTISGLPFDVATNCDSAMPMGFWGSTTGTYVHLTGLTVPGTKTIQLYAATAAASGLTFTGAMQNATNLIFSGHYFV